MELHLELHDNSQSPKITSYTCDVHIYWIPVLLCLYPCCKADRWCSPSLLTGALVLPGEGHAGGRRVLRPRQGLLVLGVSSGLSATTHPAAKEGAHCPVSHAGLQQTGQKTRRYVAAPAAR